MIKEIEEQFFTEYRLGGVANVALGIVRHNHNLEVYAQTGKTPEPWATHFKGGYKESLKKQEEAFDASILLEPVSALIEEIRANIESSDGLHRERYLTSLLTPFKAISDLAYPDRTILVKLHKRKDELMAGLKFWSKAKDKKDAEGQIAAAKSLIETIDEDCQRQVDVAKRIWNLCSKPIDDKDDYALCVFARFWRLLGVYANRLDALLLEYNIDIMTLQQDAGIWILTSRDITLLQHYCGSLQLARKYLDELPQREVKPPVVLSASTEIPTQGTEDIQTSKEVLTFNEAVQFTGYSESYLYKLTSGQKIPYSKPTGKLIYFNRKELETWLLQNRVSTTDEIAEKAQIYCMSNTKGRNAARQ
jgi:excisionase family DNA binding protein